MPTILESKPQVFCFFFTDFLFRHPLVSVQFSAIWKSTWRHLKPESEIGKLLQWTFVVLVWILEQWLFWKQNLGSDVSVTEEVTILLFSISVYMCSNCLTCRFDFPKTVCECSAFDIFHWSYAPSTLGFSKQSLTLVVSRGQPSCRAITNDFLRH